MSNATEQLKQLEQLQHIQNAEVFGERVLVLEDQVNRLSTIIENMRLTLSQLQMDLHRDHATLADSHKY